MISFTNKIMYYNLGCEMVFILNNRLKTLDIDDSKRVMILAQIADNLFRSEENQKLLNTNSSLLSIEGMYNILYKVCHKSVITLDSVSFQKMIEMVLMALKKDVLLTRNNFGLCSVTNNHLTSIEKMIQKKDSTETVRAMMNETFKNIPNYDFFMIKREILNLLAFKHLKISIYQKDKSQSTDGHFFIKSPRIAGFNVFKPGTTVSSTGMETSRGFRVDPETKFKQCSHWTEEENDGLGYDVFENLKKNELVIVDKDYLSKIQNDMSQKILGSQTEKNERLVLQFDFEAETAATTPSQGKQAQGQMFVFDKSKAESNKTHTKVTGMLKEDDDDDAPASKKKGDLTGNDLLDMMDDL